VCQTVILELSLLIERKSAAIPKGAIMIRITNLEKYDDIGNYLLPTS